MSDKTISQRDLDWLDKYGADEADNASDMKGRNGSLLMAMFDAVYNNSSFVAFDYLYTASLGDMLSDFALRGYEPFNIHSAKIEDRKVYWRVVLKRNVSDE